MHPNPIYHTADDEKNLAYARERAFGVLAVNGGNSAPLLSHVPFLLSDDGRTAELHLVRSNPIVRMLDKTCAARIAVSGPDSYISPDWYGVADQVPTWNYIAVHLTGELELRPQEELHDLLDRQSALFENRLIPKTPWVTGKMPADLMERMMRMIVPCRMRVTAVDGTWKLSQNKTSEARLLAADHVDTDGMGAESAAIAKMMRATAET